MKSAMKLTGALLFVLMIGSNLNAQKYFSKAGEISFYSHTPIEDIEALSNTATTVYDAESGKIQWAVLVKSFEFEKALMQEHFNENYMESSKYPTASFKGQLADDSELHLQKDGKYVVEVSGELTIHGVTQPVTTQATFTVENGAITAQSDLKVLVADYGIDIPSVVKENIAKELEISIKANYEVLDRS